MDGTDEWPGYDLEEDLLSSFPRMFHDKIDRIVRETDRDFRIVMKDEFVIRAHKAERWRTWWVYMIDGHAYNTRWIAPMSEMRTVLKERYMSDHERLMYELEHHDWYYDFSDDHRVWQGGQAHMRLIKALMQKIIDYGDEQFVRDAWNDYAPKGNIKFDFPFD